MTWDSVLNFLAMGGYGRYVWGSYAFCAVVIGWEHGWLSRRIGLAKQAVRRSEDKTRKS